MPERFFLTDDPGPANVVAIDGALARHIARSLRMRAGDTLVAVDRSGREHGVRLSQVTPQRVDGDIAWTRPVTGEPRLRITILQALPRERMDDCVDILVEAGAGDIRPVITERVVTRVDPDRVAGRVVRWQAVAQEAAQLAGRGIIPRVHAPQPLGDALSGLAAGTRLIAPVFDGTRGLATLEVDPMQPLALCIGPEGGLGPRDLGELERAGAEWVHLGARILRTRYAGALACTLLLAASGDLAQPLATVPAP